ncbi:MAG: hypothetical protein ABR577_04215 [Pyrinomonadaceae bacterium]
MSETTAIIEANEAAALAQLQRTKASYQSFIKLNYEHAAEDCRVCPTKGACCTDAHFVNVHITRLEAVHLRETLARTPRLTFAQQRAVYVRAAAAVTRYHLRASGDTFAQTFACPLFEPQTGCLVHKRAKPAPCIQHACYERWEDLPPLNLQTRTEHRIEQLNTQVYGAAWAWLPTPLWLCLVDPETDGAELNRLARAWGARGIKSLNRPPNKTARLHGARSHQRSLPVIN